MTAPTLDRENVPVTKATTLASAEVVEATVPKGEPQFSLDLVQVSATRRTHQTKLILERERGVDRIRLRRC